MKLIKRYIADRPDYINALHVDDCPIPAREWQGKPYANVVADCFECPYLGGIVKDETAFEEEEDIKYILCPESLTEDQRSDPKIWGWGSPEGTVS